MVDLTPLQGEPEPAKDGYSVVNGALAVLDTQRHRAGRDPQGRASGVTRSPCTRGALAAGGGVPYHGCMTKAADAVLADALRLEPEARAEVAAEILASLEGPADPDADAAWTEEIEKRIAALEAGTMKLESWDEVKRRISGEILGR